MAAQPAANARVPQALHTRRPARAPRDGGSNVPAPPQPAAGMESLSASRLPPAFPGRAAGGRKQPLPRLPSRGAGRGAGCPPSRLHSKISRRVGLGLPLPLAYLLRPRRGAAGHRPVGLAAPEGAKAAAPHAGEAGSRPALLPAGAEGLLA